MREKLLTDIGRRPRIHEIQQLVAARFEIDVDDLVGCSRKTKLVIARRFSMKLCATYVWMSHYGIAHAHNRDHSTMFTGMRKIDEMFKLGRSPFVGYFSAIEAQLRERGFRLHARARGCQLPVLGKLGKSNVESRHGSADTEGSRQSTTDNGRAGLGLRS
jgi:hypothetical protein